MFRRKQRGFECTTDADIQGFLAEGDSLSGTVDLHGGFRVDGKIVGKVTSPALLIVGPTGMIEAQELHVASLSVSGVVRGNLEIDERLEVHPGGKVYGRVKIAGPGLVVAPGGILEATLEMEKHDVPQDSMIQPGSTDSRPMTLALQDRD